MPYKSLAQQAYFHANRGKLESQGVNVAEWDQASKGAKLPEKVEDGGHSHLKSALSRQKAK